MLDALSAIGLIVFVITDFYFFIALKVYRRDYWFLPGSGIIALFDRRKNNGLDRR